MIAVKAREMQNSSFGMKGVPFGVNHSFVKPLYNIIFRIPTVVPSVCRTRVSNVHSRNIIVPIDEELVVVMVESVPSTFLFRTKDRIIVANAYPRIMN